MKPLNQYTVLAFMLAALFALAPVWAATTPSSLGTGQVSDLGASYKVTLLRYEPLPAKPGSAIDVWIQVSNVGDKSGSDLELRIEDSYPFTPVSKKDRVVAIGSLSSRSDYVARVQVLADGSSLDGTFDLQASLVFGNGAISRFRLPIELESGLNSLAVTSAKTTPAELLPGERGTLAISIENLEAAELQDVTVNLALADTNLAPVGGTNQQKISRLPGGDSHVFSFSVVTEPEAVSNVYRIPVTITATTKAGESISQEETVGIIISSKPDLAVIVDNAEVYKGQAEGTVLLRIVNKGLSQVKFTQIELQNAEGYSIATNSPSVYVGNIDSDDFETVEYAIKPSADTFALKLHVTYADALNNKYEQTIDVPIMLQEQQQKGTSPLIYLVILIVIIVGIVLWRKSRKAKR